MGCFLLYTTYEQFTNYFKYPTITNTHVQTQTSVKFPAVTFCSASSLKRDSLPGDLYNLEYYLLTESVMGPFFPKLNFSNSEYSKYHVSLNESWVNNTANQVNDIFLFCFFEGKKKICENAMKATVTKLGVCYTFNSREHVSENGDILTSRTGSTSGLRLYLMVNQSNYVFSDAMAAGIKVLPSAVCIYNVLSIVVLELVVNSFYFFYKCPIKFSKIFFAIYLLSNIYLKFIFYVCVRERERERQ